LPEVPADRIRERGSAAVEFALLLPILLLLLLALVQVGVIARDSLVLTQASRAGARDKLYNYVGCSIAVTKVTWRVPQVPPQPSMA
jgi:TadE-like protein